MVIVPVEIFVDGREYDSLVLDKPLFCVFLVAELVFSSLSVMVFPFLDEFSELTLEFAGSDEVNEKWALLPVLRVLLTSEFLNWLLGCDANLILLELSCVLEADFPVDAVFPG